MFIPKENRIAVYSYLFQEGVCVVKKDTKSDKHPHIEGPNNLEVLCLMKSLASREFVRVTFSWQYNYCYLTDEGIEYLRSYLALPAEIVPATHKQTNKQACTPSTWNERQKSGDMAQAKRQRIAEGLKRQPSSILTPSMLS